MKWTTYDGHENTLPIIRRVVLIESTYKDDDTWDYRTSATGTREEIMRLAVTRKVRWLPIPTPAECETRERFESAIRDLEVQTRPDMNMADRAVNAALFRILAALAACTDTTTGEGS